MSSKIQYESIKLGYYVIHKSLNEYEGEWHKTTNEDLINFHNFVENYNKVPITNERLLRLGFTKFGNLFKKNVQGVGEIIVRSSFDLSPGRYSLKLPDSYNFTDEYSLTYINNLQSIIHHETGYLLE